VLLEERRGSSSLDRTKTEMCVYVPGELKAKEKERRRRILQQPVLDVE
jgi:hypothetical protein